MEMNEIIEEMFRKRAKKGSPGQGLGAQRLEVTEKVFKGRLEAILNGVVINPRGHYLWHSGFLWVYARGGVPGSQGSSIFSL